MCYLARKLTAVIFGCQLAKKAYRDVDAKLFDKYVEEKAGPVIGALEQNMYVGMFDWSASYHITGRRVVLVNYFHSFITEISYFLQFSIIQLALFMFAAACLYCTRAH